jgi:glucosylceramidase
VVVFKKDKQYIVTAGNSTNETKQVTVKIGNKYLNITLAAHSFNTFVSK